MAVNKGAKKLSTISKSSIKTLGTGVRAWFLVATGGDYFFGVDKKLSDPARFKDPAKLKKYLLKLKIDEAADIDKKAAVVAGTVKLNGEEQELVIRFKANGGGKSTLKGVIKDSTIKKILPKAVIVKAHSGEAAPTDEDDINAEVAAAEELQGVEGDAGKELKTALKIFKWWKKEGHSGYTAAIANPSEANEDALQKIQRRLTKFYDGSMYNLFETHWFSADGPLKKYKQADFDLDKSSVKGYLKAINKALLDIEEQKDRDGEEEEADAMAHEALDDLLDDLDAIAELLGLSARAIPEFKSAVEANRSTFDPIWHDFSTDTNTLIQLKDVLGDGTWEGFLRIAAEFEQ